MVNRKKAVVRRWIPAASTLLVGLALGFAAARVLERPPAPTASPEPSTGPVTVRWPVAEAPEEAAGTDAPRRARDPATLTGILRIQGDFAQTAALYELVAGAGRETLERLIDEVDDVPRAGDRRAAVSILYARYADLDPAAGLAFLESRDWAYADVALRALFHGWSRADLAAAVDAAEALRADRRQPAAMAILAARDDLAAMALRDIAVRLEAEELLAQVTMQRTFESARRDPAAAWQEALGSDDRLHAQRLVGIARSWARLDPLAALSAAAALQDAGIRAQVQAQIVRAWAGENPREAAEWVLSQPVSLQRQQLSAQALSALAERQPQLAFDIARGLSGQERSTALAQVLGRWAEQDAAAAARALEAVPPGEGRRAAIHRIADRYVRQDPDGALQWLAGMNGQERLEATAMVFAVLARRDPARAGDLISRLPPSAERTNAAGAVAQAWARQDPQAAARWVASLDDRSQRSQARASLISQWALADRDAALRNVERIADPAEREAGLVMIIMTQYQDLDFAESLFDRLTDPSSRATAAQMLYSRLRRVDPQRAERYRELMGPTDGGQTMIMQGGAIR